MHDSRERDGGAELDLDRLLRGLPAQIQLLITLRLHGGMTQSEIAEQFGISETHVSRLLRRASAWLRAAMASDVPPPWDRAEEYDPAGGIQVLLRQTETEIGVEIIGVIDDTTADRLGRRLQSAISLASPGQVTVDLTRVALMDAAGAATLRDAVRSAALSQVTMTICGAAPQVASAIRATVPDGESLRHPIGPRSAD